LQEAAVAGQQRSGTRPPYQRDPPHPPLSLAVANRLRMPPFQCCQQQQQQQQQQQDTGVHIDLKTD
jgi:hypothetical protein